jgi:NADH-quinone oxidoreductase subunit F
VSVPWTTYLLDRTRQPDSQRIEVYERNGGYKALRTVLSKEQRWKPEDVTAVVKESGLRGRGGAGFPTGLKWSFMPDPAKDPRKRYLAVNADESEPGTCKDRVLMELDPHGLVEGCVLAAYAMRVQAVYIYVRGEYRLSYERVAAAIDEARKAGYVGQNVLGSDFGVEIWMHKGAGAYICGEETGLMESLEGKRGHPRPKPPFPAGSGLWASPTTVNNVETLFNVPFIVERGAEWFRTMGTEKSSGNFLCGISGHVARPGVYEVPFGVSARRILEQLAGGVWRGRKLKAWFPGGSSSGLLPAERIDTPMDHDGTKNAGSMFGTGAMIVLDDTVALAEAERIIARFYEHESCGQCSQCREGTQWLDQILQRIATGKGKPEDPALLESLSRGMAPGKTICALADAAAIPTLALLKGFRPEIEAQARTGQAPAGTAPLSEIPHGALDAPREVQA